MPDCKEGAEDDEWKCALGESKSQDLKDIKTLGDFAQYCVKPAMEKRAVGKKDEAKGK